jgi:hypothetical protein
MVVREQNLEAGCAFLRHGRTITISSDPEIAVALARHRHDVAAAALSAAGWCAVGVGLDFRQKWFLLTTCSDPCRFAPLASDGAFSKPNKVRK